MAIRREKPTWRTKSEFAKMAGCSAPAVTRAVREGRIATVKEGTFIDIENPRNVHFLENCQGRKQKTDVALGDQEVAKAVAREMSEELKQKEAALQLAQQYQGRGSLPPLPPTPAPGGDQKVDYEIAKIYASTMKLNADLATTLKKLVKRELVDNVVNKIGTVIAEHLLTMGDRISSDIAAVFENSDPDRINQVKRLLDKDNTRTIQSLKRIIREEYEAKTV